MASQMQIAGKLGISEKTFKELVAKGVISQQDRGKYDYEVCARQYLDYLREIAAGRMSEDGLDLMAERARLAKEQADAKEMENAVERGDLVYISDIVQQFENQLMNAKTKLLSIPTKVAAEVNAAKDVKECKLIIEEAIIEALSELVGYDKEASSEET